MRARWRRTKRDEAGFTLIELAIALAVLGILVAIAVPTYLSVRNRAYDAEAKQHLGEIRTLAWTYYLEKGDWTGTDLSTFGVQHTATQNWEFSVLDGDKESIVICAKPVSGAPFENRVWRLELDSEGSATLEGPDATCD